MITWSHWDFGDRISSYKWKVCEKHHNKGKYSFNQLLDRITFHKIHKTYTPNIDHRHKFKKEYERELALFLLKNL